jgi:uncharacterized protein (TIGR03066 family)
LLSICRGIKQGWVKKVTFARTRRKAMAMLRVALAGMVLLAAVSVGLAQKEKSKIDKAKLVGTWTFVKTTSKQAPPAEAVIKVEFTTDGKFNMSFTVGDKSHKGTGTYKVEGNQLTTVMKGPDNKEKKDTVTIKELTDKKFVTEEKEGGKTVTSEFKK